MAEEKEPKADVKAAKKAKKTAVPEAPEPEQALPTAGEIRTAKKAELLAWTERYGLSQEGKVDDLRQRLRTFIEKRAAKEAAPKEEEPAPPKVEERQREAEGETEAFEREEGQEGRSRGGGRGRSPRAAGQAKARASPEETSRPAIGEERGAS